ncbi:MAG: hypothetical protein IPJ51_10420 [Saprospiraceae bacterium]|nr:hypothetical protein [Saprospiraceae bacterium]
MDERDQKARQDELNVEVGKIQKVKAVQDESCHWYIIPFCVYKKWRNLKPKLSVNAEL